MLMALKMLMMIIRVIHELMTTMALIGRLLSPARSAALVGGGAAGRRGRGRRGGGAGVPRPRDAHAHRLLEAVDG